MKTEITQFLFKKTGVINSFLVLSMLCLTSSVFSQTIIDVFPTRVTTKTKVTIIGTDFTETTRANIQIVGYSNQTAVTNRQLVSSTEMSFDISLADTSNISNLTLTIGSVIASEPINYVAPTNINYSTATQFTANVSEIFTTYNGFWRSGPLGNGVLPDNRHDLLGFTFNGATYSTGVNDALLTSNGITFTPQTFKAYSTNGVEGKTHSANYLAMGDMIDDVVDEGTGITSPNILGANIYGVIIDGVNGLDLGTGITNFNQNASVRFYSGNGQVGAVSDPIPDLLITQIADPGSPDIYYYADEEGNVVGNPIKLNIVQNNATRLTEWKLDLYSLTSNANYDVAVPTTRAFGNNETRPLRILGFRLEQFGINDTNILDVNNINMMAGGTADIAFMAYNRSAFEIKAPLVERAPVSRFVCRLPSSSEITFNVLAGIDGTPSSDPNEVLTYQWSKYNYEISGETFDEYTIPDIIDASDLGTYRLKISNGYGSVVLPVTLSEGGTPTFWNGSSWALPPTYVAAGLSVNDNDRSLIFNSDYNEDVDLVGCDCRIPAGSTATIPQGRTLKLYNTITVEPAIAQVLDPFGNVVVSPVNAGVFILEDNASLIQTKAVTTNENSLATSIRVKREASGLHTYDYVYWSSPVEGFITAAIPGSNNHTYRWETNTLNSNSTLGTWAAYSGTMETGRGYIKRVSSAATFTNTFIGRPNNGPYARTVYKSNGGTLPTLLEDRHWNLVGNPYPSALNTIKFLTANTNIEGNVRVWTHSAAVSASQSSPFYSNFAYNYGDQYVTFNGTGSTPPNTFNGNIGSGQGFFVQVRNSSANTSSISFNNLMRYDASENAYDNSEFFRMNATEAASNEMEPEKHLIWLSLVNESNSSSVSLLGYVEGATNENDRMYDALSESGIMRIYSVLGDYNLAIQGRALPFQDSDTVPFAVELTQNGIYKIAIDQVQGTIFGEQEQAIYLEDTYNNVIHDLRSSPYSFAGVEGTTVDRFILRYTNDSALSVNEHLVNDTYVYIKDKQLYVKSSNNLESIQLYDMTGKQLITYQMNGQSNTFDTTFQFPKGVYLAVITLDNKIVVTKKLIN